MIKYLLNDIPIYLMFVLNMPSMVKTYLKGRLRSFLWVENATRKDKIPLLAWDKVCLPKECCQAGLRNLDIQNRALGAKMI